jgi:hypothetical protein
MIRRPVVRTALMGIMVLAATITTPYAGRGDTARAADPLYGWYCVGTLATCQTATLNSSTPEEASAYNERLVVATEPSGLPVDLSTDDGTDYTELLAPTPGYTETQPTRSGTGYGYRTAYKNGKYYGWKLSTVPFRSKYYKCVTVAVPMRVLLA